MIYIKLFLTFAFINILGFGNGLTMLPIFKEELVNTNNWITLGEFINMIPISQATPGPMVVNIATFTGVKTAGIFGGIISTIGVTITTAIVSLVLACLYKKNKEVLFVQELMNILRPITIALIAIAAISVMETTLFANNTADVMGFLIFAASLIAINKFKVNYVWVLLSCGVINMIARTVLNGISAL